MAGYGSDIQFQAFLDAGGYSIPASPPGLSIAVLRQRGSDYIDAVYGERFAGYPTGGVAQERQWPRTGAVTTRGQIIPDDVIPEAVVRASYFAALQESAKPGSLSVIVGGEGAVKRKKVGSLEIEYAGAGDQGSVSSLGPLLSSVDGLLAPFLAADDSEMRNIYVRAIG